MNRGDIPNRRSAAETKQVKEDLRPCLLENETLKAISIRQDIILSSIPDIIMELDSDRVYIWTNSSGLEFFGENVLGRNASEFFEGERVRKIIVQPLFSNTEKLTYVESWQRRKDGEIRLLAWWYRGIKDENGKAKGAIATARDITEQRFAEQELERYRNHLEEIVEARTVDLGHAVAAANAANQAKSTFLANMSHEIRTPMNAVLGFAQLLKRDQSLSPEARNKVATIIKSGEHLLSIINDILEISRIESGRVEARFKPVDLLDIMNDLSVMFQLRAEEKGLGFSLESAHDLPRHIMTDMDKLRQILINLLGNAVKFTKTGSIALRACRADSGKIVIEVQDTGIGIAPDEQEKLFQPFERTRSGEQAAGGTGLGLAISREYAHLIGGEIAVESVSGVGSTFRLEFTAEKILDAPVSTDTSRCVIGLVPGQEDIRVLVVDDQDTNRELIRGILEPLGFSVNEASDGAQAIEMANSRAPRIIMMDMVMPGMNGAEATRILRSSHSKESLTIIGITASTFEKEKQQFLDSGIDAYIAKPFREQELFDVLARHAGIRFEIEKKENTSGVSLRGEMPTLDKMPAYWREAFREALARNSITRIRKLSAEARESDPALSDWLVARTAFYDLDGLKMLNNKL